MRGFTKKINLRLIKEKWKFMSFVLRKFFEFKDFNIDLMRGLE